jgi:eukaryotic-like serine/threonine-protein kinase
MAIQLKPKWAPLYRNRAEVLLGLKDLTDDQREAALRDLEDAIRYEIPGKPEIPADRTRQAALLHHARRQEEALEACDAALEVDSKYAPAHRLRIRVLLELKRYDDLIRSCDVALGSSRPSAEIYELRGMARDALGDFPGAIADYTLSLSLQADDPRVLCRRGWSYVANDAHRPAAHDFDAAIRLSPTNADAYNGRGFARARLGQYRDAVSDAEEALRRGDSSWRIAYNAARVYAQAAIAAGSEARRTGQDAIHLVSRYQDRAMALIRVALERAPADRRSTLLRETIQPDPALQPIRRRMKSLATPNVERQTPG